MNSQTPRKAFLRYTPVEKGLFNRKVHSPKQGFLSRVTLDSRRQCCYYLTTSIQDYLAIYS